MQEVPTKEAFDQQLTTWLREHLFGDVIESAYANEDDYLDFLNRAKQGNLSTHGFNPLTCFKSDELELFHNLEITIKLTNGKAFSIWLSEFGGITIKDNES